MNSINELSDALYGSIEQVVGEYITRAGYDRTITATILKCDNEATGKYVVKYQDSNFYAYAANIEATYPKDTMVYVLIPGNDLTKHKTILGAVKNDGISKSSVIPRDAHYLEYGTNLITIKKNKFGLCSYRPDKIIIYQDTEENLSDDNDIIETENVYINLAGLQEYIINNDNVDTLKIGGIFQTSLPEEQKYNGFYGLNIVFSCIKDNEKIERVFTLLSNKDMTGNPYSYVIPTEQIAYIDIKDFEIASIKEITFFAENFPNVCQDYSKLNDIFLNGVILQGCEKLSNDLLTGTYLRVTAPQGTIFFHSDAEDKILPLQAEIWNGGHPVPADSTSLGYYWFKEKVSVHQDESNYLYDKFGGNGWECLETLVASSGEHKPGDGVLKVKKKNLQMYSTKFKNVAIYNAQKFSKEIIMINKDALYKIELMTDNNRTLYSKTDNSNIKVYLKIYNKAHYKDNWKDVTDDLKSSSNIVWYYEDSWGNYKTPIVSPDRTFITVPLSQFNDKRKILCEVTLFNGIQGSTSLDITKADGLTEPLTLVILNDNAPFVYDEWGISPTNDKNNTPREILPLRFQIYDNINHTTVEGNSDNVPIEKTLWSFPLPNESLINPPVEAIEVTNGNNTALQFKGYEATFTLDDNYSYAENYNNQVRLDVVYKGVALTATVNIDCRKQGEDGTNGTGYFLKIVPVFSEDSPWPKDQDQDYLPIVPFYRENNKLICQWATPIPWNWFNIQLYFEKDLIYEGCCDGVDSSGNNAVTVKWNFKHHTQQNWQESSLYEVLEGGYFKIKDNLDDIDLSKCCHIIEAIVNFNGQEIIATKSIGTLITPKNETIVEETDYKDDIYLTKNSGYLQVVYQSDGTKPAYNTSSFFTLKEKKTVVNNKVIYDSIIKDIEWQPIGKYYDTSLQDWEDSADLKEQGLLATDNFTIKPADTYSGFCLTNAIVGSNLEKDIYIHIPIQFYLNRYANKAINGWDGNSININEEEGVILAPQIGAGKKEDDNSFTGVLIGRSKLHKEESVEDKIGLFGFSHGEESIFLNAEDGSARFGIDNIGSIKIQPFDENGKATNEVKIESGNYFFDKENGRGMSIGFGTSPYIRYGNQKFIVDYGGNLTTQDADIQGQFKAQNLSSFDESKILIGAKKDTEESEITLYGYTAEQEVDGETGDNVVRRYTNTKTHIAPGAFDFIIYDPQEEKKEERQKPISYLKFNDKKLSLKGEFESESDASKVRFSDSSDQTYIKFTDWGWNEKPDDVEKLLKKLNLEKEQIIQNEQLPLLEKVRKTIAYQNGIDEANLWTAEDLLIPINHWVNDLSTSYYETTIVDGKKEEYDNLILQYNNNLLTQEEFIEKAAECLKQTLKREEQNSFDKRINAYDELINNINNYKTAISVNDNAIQAYNTDYDTLTRITKEAQNTLKQVTEKTKTTEDYMNIVTQQSEAERKVKQDKKTIENNEDQLRQQKQAILDSLEKLHIKTYTKEQNDFLKTAITPLVFSYYKSLDKNSPINNSDFYYYSLNYEIILLEKINSIEYKGLYKLDNDVYIDYNKIDRLKQYENFKQECAKEYLKIKKELQDIEDETNKVIKEIASEKRIYANSKWSPSEFLFETYGERVIEEDAEGNKKIVNKYGYAEGAPENKKILSSLKYENGLLRYIGTLNFNDEPWAKLQMQENKSSQLYFKSFFDDALAIQGLNEKENLQSSIILKPGEFTVATRKNPEDEMSSLKFSNGALRLDNVEFKLKTPVTDIAFTKSSSSTHIIFKNLVKQKDDTCVQSVTTRITPSCFSIVGLTSSLYYMPDRIDDTGEIVENGHLNYTGNINISTSHGLFRMRGSDQKIRFGTTLNDYLKQDKNGELKGVIPGGSNIPSEVYQSYQGTNPKVTDFQLTPYGFSFSSYGPVAVTTQEDATVYTWSQSAVDQSGKERETNESLIKRWNAGALKDSTNLVNLIRSEVIPDDQLTQESFEKTYEEAFSAKTYNAKIDEDEIENLKAQVTLTPVGGELVKVAAGTGHYDAYGNLVENGDYSYIEYNDENGNIEIPTQAVPAFIESGTKELSSVMSENIKYEWQERSGLSYSSTTGKFRLNGDFSVKNDHGSVILSDDLMRIMFRSYKKDENGFDIKDKPLTRMSIAEDTFYFYSFGYTNYNAARKSFTKRGTQIMLSKDTSQNIQWGLTGGISWSDGVLTIKGRIEADEGQIGDWKLSGGLLVSSSGNAILNGQTGTLYLSNGSITSNGNGTSSDNGSPPVMSGAVISEYIDRKASLLEGGILIEDYGDSALTWEQYSLNYGALLDQARTLKNDYKDTITNIDKYINLNASANPHLQAQDSTWSLVTPMGTSYLNSKSESSITDPDEKAFYIALKELNTAVNEYKSLLRQTVILNMEDEGEITYEETDGQEIPIGWGNSGIIRSGYGTASGLLLGSEGRREGWTIQYPYKTRKQIAESEKTDKDQQFEIKENELFPYKNISFSLGMNSEWVSDNLEATNEFWEGQWTKKLDDYWDESYFTNIITFSPTSIPKSYKEVYEKLANPKNVKDNNNRHYTDVIETIEYEPKLPKNELDNDIKTRGRGLAGSLNFVIGTQRGFFNADDTKTKRPVAEQVYGTQISPYLVKTEDIFLTPYTIDDKYSKIENNSIDKIGYYSSSLNGMLRELHNTPKKISYIEYKKDRTKTEQKQIEQEYGITIETNKAYIIEEWEWYPLTYSYNKDEDCLEPEQIDKSKFREKRIWELSLKSHSNTENVSEIALEDDEEKDVTKITLLPNEEVGRLEAVEIDLSGFSFTTG